MNNLKKLRKLNNLTQKDVANLLNIEQSTYGKYERDEIPLNFHYGKILANYYKVSLSYLVDIDNEEITITLQQYKDLIKARDTINSIEKIYEKKIKNS